MKNARFWTFENGDWVKITLRPGETLGFEYGGPTDEGFEYGSVEWTHEGDRVSREWYRRERDCDGVFTNGGVCVAGMDRLAAVPGYDDPSIMRPDWTDGESWQRDHSAEGEGY